MNGERTDSNNGRIEGKIVEVKENGLLVLKLRNKELMTFEFKELQLHSLTSTSLSAI